MKKSKRPYKTSKTPPSDWPTEAEWTVIEKRLSKKQASKILSPNASPTERVKYDLCKHFIKYHQAAGISQREMAEQLGVTESRVSEILHYHIERFTIDKLLTLLNKIRPEIRIQVA